MKNTNKQKKLRNSDTKKKPKSGKNIFDNFVTGPNEKNLQKCNDLVLGGKKEY